METTEYVARLMTESTWVELRHQHRAWDSYWFNDPEELVAKARELCRIGNLFTSLNKVTSNPIKPISNDNVLRYTRLFFDLDPARPQGTSSTESELEDSFERANALKQHLSGHGWPAPAMAVSGNGCHLQYRVALPNDDETRQLMRYLYDGLKARFDDDVVGFDVSVRNPGRICTLYGSIKRKGESSRERPHRKSEIHSPRQWKQVHINQFRRLAKLYAPIVEPRPVAAPPAAGPGNWMDFRTLDVVRWFAGHGAYLRHLVDNKHAVICPWRDEHTSASPRTGSDTVIFENAGSWPVFYCSHSHCVDRQLRQVMDLWGDASRFCTGKWESA